jgi:hypothetical protein
VTTTIEKPTTSPAPSTRVQGPRRQGRLATIVVLICGLIGAAVLRGVSLDFQNTNIGQRHLGTSQGTLGNMNSYALALLLGGLRGPLVMFLWTTSENQKTDRDLEDLDTKIEWIRMLQPEFDTVHLFQMWNKAYNLSVLMASPANKYSIIMEAIGYGKKVDAERPGDLNILQAIGGIYSGKLAASNLPEAPFYMRQFREESMTAENRKLAFPEDAKSFQQLSDMKPLLDANNDLRADLISPQHSRPAQLAPDAPYNDGSLLEYLAKYKHFPDGVSPQAMAYNYSKRAQVAMASEAQKPLQLSPMVIDSQPGLMLKMWAEDELERGHEQAARAYGLKLTSDVMGNSQLLAQVPLNQPIVDRHALDGALYSYELTGRLCVDATAEIRRHVSAPQYAARITLYRAHLDDLTAVQHVTGADHDYLAATVASGQQRTLLLQSSLERYRQARLVTERIQLETYTEAEVLADPDFLPEYNNHAKILKLPEGLVDTAYNRSLVIAQKVRASAFNQERSDYGRIVSRCVSRIDALQKALDSK